MSASAGLHHALLALAVLALADAGLRVAARAVAAGLARVLAATALAAATAVVHALLLGLVELGGNPYALSAAAVLTGLAARLALPTRHETVTGRVGAWWREARLGERAAAGAAAGVVAAWTAWLLRYPALGHDMILYHVPEAVRWVQLGTPGSVEPVITGVPVGAYPVTLEVLLAWAMGIARSFVPVTLIVAAAPVVVAAAVWAGLRALGVGRAGAGLAAGALVATPAVTASAFGGASLDPVALGWLCSAGTLVTVAVCRRAPALLAPALVAAALAVGTKTTAAPLGLITLGVALVLLRTHLRALARPLVLAVLLGAGAGGVWYVRNLIEHGSPLWPFVAAPWGDPQPPLIAAADISFLDRPGETLSRLGAYYLDHFGGALVVLAGALLAPLLAPRRAVIATAAAVALSVLLWMNAPFTGVVEQRGFEQGTGDATRYLLPGVAAAVLAVALASRRGGARGAVALGLLAAGLAWNLVNLFRLGFPSAPSPTTPLAGGALGVLVAVVVTALGGRPRAVHRLPRWAPAAAGVLLAGVLLAPVAGGYVARHAETGGRQAAVTAWLTSQPRWREGDDPVATSFSLIGPLAGDRLRHPLALFVPREPCPRLRARAARGWLVFDRVAGVPPGVARCLGRPGPDFQDADYRAYAPRGN